MARRHVGQFCQSTPSPHSRACTRGEDHSTIARDQSNVFKSVNSYSEKQQGDRRMTNLTPFYAAKDDAALEQSNALEQCISRLQADHAERSAQRRARYAEDARIQDRARDLMFGSHLRSNAVELRQLAEDRRKLIEGRPKLVQRPLLMEGLPIRRAPADTERWFGKTPPYDFTWTSGSGQGGESATTGGNIDLNTQSLGGEKSVGGGIGFWFSAGPGGDSAARFTNTCRFSLEW
jgi:hypothetical protein